jgi:hypothetical protein
VEWVTSFPFRRDLALCYGCLSGSMVTLVLVLATSLAALRNLVEVHE